MTAERAAELVAMFRALRGSNEQITMASMALTDAYTRQETVECLFVAMNSADEFIKCNVAMALKNMIRAGTFNPDGIEGIKNSLLQILIHDDSATSRRLFGDTALQLLERVVVWPELCAVLMQYLSQPLTAATGLYLWTGVAAIVPEMGMLQYFEGLMACICQAIKGDDCDCRFYSIQLFDVLTGVVDRGLFADYEQIPRLFLEEAELLAVGRIATAGLEHCKREGCALFECVYEQFMNENPLFEPHSAAFVKLALDFTSSDAHPALKCTCQSILELATQWDPDHVADHLPVYLNATMNLGIAMRELDGECQDISFVGTFTNAVAGNTEAGESLITFLLGFAEDAVRTGNAAALHVSIVAIAATLQEAKDEIADNGDRVMGLIHHCMHLDAAIFDACCSFLLEASDTNPQLLVKRFDDLVASLFKHVREPRALQALDFMMYSVDVAPTNYVEVLSALTGLMSESPDRSDALVACMTSAISNVRVVMNDLYATMRPFLIRLLESDLATRAKVIECFGFLTKIAPHAIRADLPALMHVMFQSLADDDDDMSENIALSVKNIVDVLPMELAPFVAVLVPHFMRLVEKEAPLEMEANDEEEDIDLDGSPGSKMVRMRGTVLDTLTTLIANLHESMAPFAERIVEVMCLFLNVSNSVLQTSAAKSITIPVCEGLKRLGFGSAKALLGVIIDNIHDAVDLELACALLLALGSVLVSFSEGVFDAGDIERCMTLFRECFSGKVSVIWTKKKALDTRVIPSLFFASRMFVFSLAENFASFAEAFRGMLKPHTADRKRTTRAFLVHLLGAMSFACPSCIECARAACLTGIACLSGKTDDKENVFLSGLNFVVTQHKDLLTADQVAGLRTAVVGIITGRASGSIESDMIVGTAVTLWCSMVTAFGPFGDSFGGELNVVLSLLPPVIDDDDIPFVARFTAEALVRWPDIVRPHANRIVANIFASGEWCLRLIPTPLLTQLSAVIVHIGDDELWSLVKWNQNHFTLIKRHLTKYVQ